MRPLLDRMGFSVSWTPCAQCPQSPRRDYRGWNVPLSLVPLWLLCGTITGAVSVKVIVNRPSVQVRRGGSVLLPCSFRTTAALNRLNIIWTVSPLLQPQLPLQVISYEQGQIVESVSEYTGRVQFAFHPTTDASILINQSRSSDTGTYHCTVINPPDGTTPNIGLVGLTVLVEPSRPVCSSEGREEEGGSVRLRCSIREGVPAPRILWEKIPGEGPALITSQEGDLQGSVTLNNVTPRASGFYRCTVSNQLGSQTCTIELHIQVVLHLHQQSRGTWQDQELRDCKMNTVSPGKRSEVTQSPEFNVVQLSRVIKPMWLLSRQTSEAPRHLLYEQRPTPRGAALGPVGGKGEEFVSESEEGDVWGRSNSDPSRDPPPELSVSYSSTNSGFLV
ncbi:immunoglobulin superfamily member 11 isoform X4 [Xenopus laevis]|uniref:immunoglobulin superfamily member 11 isoform X4 n=1 Tax=Xenopus laevis TaxID=8355 RepID=UPI001BB0FDE6|nr:immunoglobulin superfamily member 11 isoform X4 [Xenopus laevis]